MRASPQLWTCVIFAHLFSKSSIGFCSFPDFVVTSSTPTSLLHLRPAERGPAQPFLLARRPFLAYFKGAMTKGLAFEIPLYTVFLSLSNLFCNFCKLDLFFAVETAYFPFLRWFWWWTTVPPAHGNQASFSFDCGHCQSFPLFAPSLSRFGPRFRPFLPLPPPRIDLCNLFWSAALPSLPPRLPFF